MTRKTKRTILWVGGIVVAVALINRYRSRDRMIADQPSGLFGLGILGIL